MRGVPPFAGKRGWSMHETHFSSGFNRIVLSRSHAKNISLGISENQYDLSPVPPQKGGVPKPWKAVPVEMYRFKRPIYSGDEMLVRGHSRWDRRLAPRPDTLRFSPADQVCRETAAVRAPTIEDGAVDSRVDPGGCRLSSTLRRETSSASKAGVVSADYRRSESAS